MTLSPILSLVGAAILVASLFMIGYGDVKTVLGIGVALIGLFFVALGAILKHLEKRDQSPP
jgi:hypothetical protein